MSRRRIGAEVMPVPMEGRRARLRPVAPGDTEALFALATDPEVWHRWAHRDAIPTYTQFAGQMEIDAARGLVIETLDRSEVAGWVSHYKEDRYTYADVAVLPRFFGTGLGIEAFGLWLNFLFERRNLRKVYVEALEYTVHAYDAAIQRYFLEEAHLAEHEYFAGRYWDHYTFALYRETFIEHIQPRVHENAQRRRTAHQAAATGL